RHLVDATAAVFRRRPDVAATTQSPPPQLPQSAPPSPSESPASVERPPPIALPQPEPDLMAAAQLCTEFGRLDDTRAIAPLFEAACRILDASGLIVWVLDPQSDELTPALAHGYSGAVLAQLPRVRRDDDNATAAALRSGDSCIVNGSDQASGAVVVPLMTAAGCAGVLAVE